MIFISSILLLAVLASRALTVSGPSEFRLFGSSESCMNGVFTKSGTKNGAPSFENSHGGTVWYENTEHDWGYKDLCGRKGCWTAACGGHHRHFSVTDQKLQDPSVYAPFPSHDVWFPSGMTWSNRAGLASGTVQTVFNPTYREVQWPDRVFCPTGYNPISSASECATFASSNGKTYMGELTNDENWVQGCFEWYSTPTYANSGKYYFNHKSSFVNYGYFGGHRVCIQYDDPMYRELQWPDRVSCPAGYKTMSSARECATFALSKGKTFSGILNNDINWVQGCFEGYPTKTPANSGKYYFNAKSSSVDHGDFGGHRVCIKEDDTYRELQWPDRVSCPAGYKRMSSASECSAFASSNGKTYMGVLNSDINWVQGCFEWYPTKTPANSGKYYFNHKRLSVDHGYFGGHRVCIKADDHVHVKVNFQPEDMAVPAGYIPDSGHPFGDRGNGLFYGWSCDFTNGARDRYSRGTRDSSLVIPDRFDECSVDEWEMQVPDGSYVVEIGFSDPQYGAQTNGCKIEGKSVGMGMMPRAVSPQVRKRSVEVTDGRLTLSGSFLTPDPSMGCSSISFMHIETEDLALSLLRRLAAGERDGEKSVDSHQVGMKVRA